MQGNRPRVRHGDDAVFQSAWNEQVVAVVSGMRAERASEAVGSVYLKNK